MNSILIIDKQPGITSYALIKQLKQILGIKKIGHSGTLDKFASGVLIICTGWTTKLTRYFLESDKRYIGTIRLGILTDTYDSEGTIIEYKEVRNLNPRKINEISKESGEKKHVVRKNLNILHEMGFIGKNQKKRTITYFCSI